MNILVLTYWSFNEPLIHAWTLPYLRMIREVSEKEVHIHLLTLEKEGLRIPGDQISEVKARLEDEGITLIDRRYHKFGIAAMRAWLVNIILLRRYCKRHDIQVLHAFGSPAATAALTLSKLTAIPYVIDSYEPHVESMVENGSWKRGSLAHRLLRFFERRQARTASAVLGTTRGMRDYAAKTYHHIPRFFLHKPACVDLAFFNPERSHPDITREKLGIPNDAVVCVYAGKIGGIYLREEVFDFYAACIRHWGKRFRALMLSDLPEAEMKLLCSHAGIPQELILLRFVPHTTVPFFLRLADFAINPVKPVPSKRYCTSIKDGEYWAMGLPVVIPDHISDDSDLVRQKDIGAVLEALNDEAYNNAVLKIEKLLALQDPQALKARIRSVAGEYRSVNIAIDAYRQLYGPDGYLYREEKRFFVVIYNSLRDPLFTNLVYSYILRQSTERPEYSFDLVTFEQKKYALTPQAADDERVRLTGQRIFWHPLTYHSGNFMFIKKSIDFLSAFAKLIRISLRGRPRLIIAFANTSAAISYMLARFIRTKLLVYSYEPHSEFLVEFGEWRRNGWRYRLLSSLEERVGRNADYILTGTSHMKAQLLPVAAGEVHRAPSSVDESVFFFRAKARDAKRAALQLSTQQKVLVYAGKFGGIYYEEEIGAFCQAMREKDPSWFFLFLSPTPPAEVHAALQKGGLPTSAYHLDEAHGAEAVAEWLSAADAGLTAIPPYPNQKFRSPVKVGEYLMCGLPYITCRGVSEDDTWAEEYHVGVVVDQIHSPSGTRVVELLNKLLSEDRDLLRERCRTTGIAYRGRQQVDTLFDKILQEA